MNNWQELKVLFNRYLANECSQEEEQSFLELLESEENEAFLKGLIDMELKKDVDSQFKDLPQVKEDLKRTRKKIIERISGKEVHDHSAKNKLWFKIAAILLLFAGAIFYKIDMDKPNLRADVEPGGNKAVLTLADGSEIILDQAGIGCLTQQAGVQVVKAENGQLVYTIKEAGDSNKGKASKLTNTVSTPRGGQYQVNLPDGTRVWLNAASSLKFPLSFAELKERRVELKGEAYFEVEKDTARPFIVQSDKQFVQVTGTHFNVNSYTDEPTIKTTLLEGAVNVTTLKGAEAGQVFLKPGQQAQVSTISSRVHVVKVDPMAEIAWKNGQFFFENESIENIMKQISRWYDVEVVYEGDVTGKTVWGSVTRYTNVSKVLSVLELTGEIHFKVEGRRIVVYK
jgi:transmembrane sensor